MELKKKIFTDPQGHYTIIKLACSNCGDKSVSKKKKHKRCEWCQRGKYLTYRKPRLTRPEAMDRYIRIGECRHEYKDKYVIETLGLITCHVCKKEFDRWYVKKGQEVSLKE